MSLEKHEAEYPYFLKVETAAGHSTTVPIAFLTRQQVQEFFQTEFRKLVQEAGLTGARIYVERASTADYEKVVREPAIWLRDAATRAA